MPHLPVQLSCRGRLPSRAGLRIRFAAAALMTLSLFAGLLRPPAAVATTSHTPRPRASAGMTYDSGRGETVLFGGYSKAGRLNDTWIWDGTSWTERQPPSSPSPRSAMGLAYDPRDALAVLFGGENGQPLGDTWIWDGTAWTELHPATSPYPRLGMGMTYDPSSGQVVLFGGVNGHTSLNDTWTWDGTTWTEQQPERSPPARYALGMTYDANLGEVLLFGGIGAGGVFGDTWAWDGTTWTKLHTAASPSARLGLGMSEDAALGAVVMFGGRGADGRHDDTWMWDGSTWTQMHPATSPGARDSVAMDVDARGRVLLFGGEIGYPYLGDTWTFNGTWRVPGGAHAHLSPSSGPPETVVKVRGKGFAAFEEVTITFVDSAFGKTLLGTFITRATGVFYAKVTIPAGATVGAQRMIAAGASGQKAAAIFTVT